MIAVVDQILDGVRDLELVPPGRFDRFDGLEDVRVEHVDADERQVALRLFGLFHQADDPAVLELGHTEHRGIRHGCQENQGVGLPLPELLDQRYDAALEDVVAEVHDKRLHAQEILCDQHGMGQAKGFRLFDVGNPDIIPPSFSLADRLPDLVLGVADNDPDLPDPRSDERLDPVEEHRLVGHRDQLLGLGEGQRAEPCSFAAAEDQTLHLKSPALP